MNTITFGTPVPFASELTAISYVSLVYVPDGKVVVSFRGNSGYGQARVGTTDMGTAVKNDGTMTFGTVSTFNSASTLYCASAYDSTNSRVIVAYRDVGNSNNGTAVVGTVTDSHVELDANHPLAGQTLKFDVTLVEIA